MSIQISVPTSPGSVPGLVDTISDLTRRITAIERGGGGVSIGEGALQGTMLASGTIGGVQIAGGTLTASHIQAGSITAAVIAAGTITAGLIAAGAINAGHIQADSIDADHVKAGSINAVHIQTATIEAQHLAAGSVVADTISAGAITAEKIQSGAVTTDKMSVTGGLSAISSDMGSITGGTITGGVIQTSSSGSRVVMSSTGIVGYALDGVTKVFEINAGSGVATFKGTVQSGSSVPSSTLSGTISGTLIPAIGGSNGLRDAGFEKSNEGNYWFFEGHSASSFDTTTKYNGQQSLKLTAAAAAAFGASQVVSARAASSYTLSGYILGSVSGRLAQAVISWFNSSNVLISQSMSTGIGVGTTSWLRVSLKATAPTGTAYARVGVILTAGAAGEVAYIDAVQWEDGLVLTAWAPHIDDLEASVGPGEITALELGPNSVTVGKIAANAVTANEIAAGAVTAGKVAANAIVANNIAAREITAGKIATGTLTADEIAAGAITANVIAAGAITAQKLSLRFGGQNQIPNARFQAWTATNPDSWVVYDNGTNTFTSSKIAGGGPNGENSWRIAATAIGTNIGWRTANQLPLRPNTTYVLSWWYKGTVQPTIASNGTHAPHEWIENPTVSSTVWQRYSSRRKYNASGVRATDWIYVQLTAPGTGEIANVQWEEAEVPSAFTPMADEVLPGTVGSTQLAPDSVTSEKIVARAILASDIATGTLTANEISANAITADEISSGAITSKHTITGAVIRTAASGSRVEINSSQFKLTSGETTIVSITPGAGVDLTYSAAYSGDRAIRWMSGTTRMGEITTVQSPWNTSVPSLVIRARNAANTGDSNVALYEDSFNIQPQRMGSPYYQFTYTHFFMPQKVSSYIYFYNSDDQAIMFAGHDSRVYGIKPGGARIASWHVCWGDGYQYWDAHQGYNWRNTDGGWTMLAIQPGAVVVNHQLTMASTRQLTFADGGMVGATYKVRMRESYGFRFSGDNGLGQNYGGDGTICHYVPSSNSPMNLTGATVGYSYAAIHHNYSDAKLKSGIREYGAVDSLSKVRAITPKKYDYNGTRSSMIDGIGIDSVGFLAQEVEDIIPEAIGFVYQDDPMADNGFETMRTIDPVVMTATLFSAVQELTEIILNMMGKDPTDQLSRDTEVPDLTKLPKRKGLPLPSA